MDSRIPSAAEYFFGEAQPAKDLMPPHLDETSLGRLTRTSPGIHRFFKTPLAMARAGNYTVVNSSEIEVNKIFDAATTESTQNLLIKKIARATTRSGLIVVKSTLLQLAYGAGDYVMCRVLYSIFVRIFGGEEAAKKETQRQLDEKFLEASEEEKASNAARDVEIKNRLAELFVPIIQAIEAEQFNNGEDADNKLILSPATVAAITTFREGLAALQPKSIDKGMHFRFDTVLETVNTYDQASQQWRQQQLGNDLFYLRHALFDDAVLSAVLSYVPDVDARQFSQGILQKGEPSPFVRRITLNDNHANYYNFVRGPSKDFSLLGGCVDILNGIEQHDRARGELIMTEALAREITAYAQRKRAGLRDFDDSIRQTNKRAGLQDPDESIHATKRLRT